MKAEPFNINVEENKMTGSFPMDIRGPVRPLVLDDARHLKKTPAQRRLLLALVLLVVLVIALVISLVVVVFRYESESTDKICEKEECIRSADNLIKSMDTSVDPCDDFYRFSCGRWKEGHPLPDSSYSNDWFTDTSQLINQQIQDYLETNESDTDALPVNQARQFYKSCMDTELLDDEGLQPMIKIMRSMQIPLPLPNPGDEWANFSLMWVVARIQRLLGLDVLIGFGVIPLSTNRSINKITFSSPSREPVLPGYPEVIPSKEIMRPRRSLGSTAADTIQATYIAHVMELTYRWNRTVDSKIVGKDPMFFEAAERVEKLAETLAKAHNDNATWRAGVEPNQMTIDELQDVMDQAANGTSKINVREYLHILFDGVDNVTLDLNGEDNIVLVYDEQYLRTLSAILVHVDNNTLQNLIWWRVASTLSPYTDSEMRLLKERYLEDATENFSPPTRPHFCASAVNQLMGMAVATFFLDTHSLNRTQNKVASMLTDIREAFNTLVDRLDWMDSETKKVTREKAANTNFLIGFPDWLSNNETVNEYYKGIKIEEGAFLDNLLSIAGVRMNESLMMLRETHERSEWSIDSPMEPNALHIPFSNAVVVQAGILRFPFYFLGLEALNYGAIGSILGHELTHGFDDQGRKYDSEGNLRQWWSNNTIMEYDNRTDCFVKQYNGYRLADVNDTVDGELTLGENIADNGGLREAFLAYQRFHSRHGQEPKLPGLEKYSNEQLFFLAYANVWCEKWTKKSLKSDLVDEHTPNLFRVTGVLTNSPEFTRVWKCKKGSRMNPNRDRCLLW